MFVIQKGVFTAAKMEYSYGRRSQSVTQTLAWKDVAIVRTESLEDAIVESIAAIKEWKQVGVLAEKWRLEGRGKQVDIVHDLNID